MNQSETRLIADGVEAPEFGDVHLVLGRESPRDVDTANRDVQMKGYACPSEMRPLRHRFEMVDRLCGLNLHSAFELVPLVGGGEDQVRIYLDWTNLDRDRLVVADVDHDVVPTLQACLEQTNHAIVLELLAHGPDEYRAHSTSRGRLPFTGVDGIDEFYHWGETFVRLKGCSIHEPCSQRLRRWCWPY